MVYFGRDPSARLRTGTGSVSTGTPVTYPSVFCGRPHWPTDRRPVENGNGPSHLPRFHSSFGPSAGVWLATLRDHDRDHHHDHEHLTLTLTHARAPTSTSTPAGLAFCIAPITLNAQSIQLRLGSLGSLCISPRRTAWRVAGGSYSVAPRKHVKRRRLGIRRCLARLDERSRGGRRMLELTGCLAQWGLELELHFEAGQEQGRNGTPHE
ncbi:hypothetical protein B0H13DRAFT_2563125 [Mycena leptocephala]|nr:hypothetical protein B0H13DRAFT_2563125 [Mycena leptocephala]